MAGGVIIVEGNIGAGKSTFAQILARALDGEYLPEPADGTNPYLEDCYREPTHGGRKIVNEKFAGIN